MPQTFTHAVFSKDVYNRLDSKLKCFNDNNINHLLTFSQNTDPFMFYKIECLRSDNKTRKFQKEFHNTNTKNFFDTLVLNIKERKLYNDNDVLAFLYGYICHYALDSIVHPFVIYKSGVFDKNNKELYKYNSLHSLMETYIDNYMINKKYNMNPFKFNVSKYSFNDFNFSNNLVNLVNDTFKDVFKYDDMYFKYIRSLKDMKRFLRRYRNDRFGIKRLLYSFIDLFTKPNNFKFKSISYFYYPKNIDYLNNNHNNWTNPCDNNIISNKSFDELYEDALILACNLITSVNNYFNNKEELNNIFSNNSYITGLDCSLEYKFKYFEK